MHYLPPSYRWDIIGPGLMSGLARNTPAHRLPTATDLLPHICTTSRSSVLSFECTTIIPCHSHHAHYVQALSLPVSKLSEVMPQLSIPLRSLDLAIAREPSGMIGPDLKFKRSTTALSWRLSSELSVIHCWGRNQADNAGQCTPNAP